MDVTLFLQAVQQFVQSGVDTYHEVEANRGRDQADAEMMTVCASLALQMEASASGERLAHLNDCVQYLSFSMACLVLDLEHEGIDKVFAIKANFPDGAENLN